MKKVLLSGLFIAALNLTINSALATSYDYLSAPNAGNRNFTPLMKQQFEKEETLDFIKDPDEYKVKRDKKDAYLDYKEGKTEMPEFLKPKIEIDSTRPATNSMQFIKDSNGEIKIQGMQ